MSKTIVIFHNPAIDRSHEIAREIAAFLVKKEAKIVTRDAEAVILNASPISTIDPKSVDYAISIGGDGTILTLLHELKEISAPILGINLGHLGFMADVPEEEIFPALEQLLEGKCKVEERIMIEGAIEGAKRCFAANDIVIHRGSNPSLVEISIRVGGTYFNTFEADGIIIATPNGSTAYSLAAGGPIISPGLDALVITPISPHTISNRPFVITADDEISIDYKYKSPYMPLEITADGLPPQQLEQGETLRIRRSSRKFRLIKLQTPGKDYFSTIRKKLGWTGKSR